MKFSFDVVRVTETQLKKQTLRTTNINGYNLEHTPTNIDINGYNLDHTPTDIDINGYNLEHTPTDIDINGYNLEHTPTDIDINGYNLEHTPTDIDINGYNLEHTPTDIDINGYNLEHTPTEASRGGTLLYVKNKLNYISGKDLNIYKKNELESTFSEILTSSCKNIIVGCIYRHPRMHPSVFNDIYLKDPLPNL